LRAAKPELLALLRPIATTWDDATIARFTARRDRLMRWGWPEVSAEEVAERLTRRDRENEAGDLDDRVSCVECSNFVRGRCIRHRQAGISADVGRDIAGRLQRCPAFESQP
jgi:hypothetical protein